MLNIAPILPYFKRGFRDILKQKERNKMSQKINLSTLINDSPIIKIVVSEIEVPIRIFFSINCCEIMFEQYKQTNDYRIAFAKAVFHMYQQTSKDTHVTLSENDFINTTDDNLLTILNQILEHSISVKSEYNKNEAENLYERFYKANEVILENATLGISKSLEKMSKTFSVLNTPLSTSLTNAMKTIASPFDHLSGISSGLSSRSSSGLSSGLFSGLSSITTNMFPDGFSKINSAFSDFSKTGIGEIIPNIQTAQQLDFARFQSALLHSPEIRFPELSSALLNVPLVSFNVPDIISPLQRMLDSVQLISDSLAQTLRTPLLQMAETIGFLSLLTYHKKWNKETETLLKYGWFYSIAFPDTLANIIHKNQENLSTDDVDKIIVDYFRQNRCEALKKMIKSWKGLPYFRCREQIFHEALVNHSRKYFNSSVTLLTIHTEGIITDFVRATFENPRFRVEKAIEDIKQELDENTDASVFEYEVFNDVIERIENAFKENFKHSDPDAASNESRHKIAHGHAYEKENEVNSLKRFLYLNEIYSLFALLSSTEIYNCIK